MTTTTMSTVTVMVRDCPSRGPLSDIYPHALTHTEQEVERKYILQSLSDEECLCKKKTKTKKIIYIDRTLQVNADTKSLPSETYLDKG